MNIIMFGPNGSGKGTFGAIVSEKFMIPQVETGVIFRENIAKGTELGKKAKSFIDRGELVPDDITIPMILKRLQDDDCKNGWLLDGFPRNITQAEAFWSALQKEKIKLDYVIELEIDRETAKKRIMGRRLCPNDNNHPNNIYVKENLPVEKDGKLFCRVCGREGLLTRADDQDEAAIDKRHSIYFDTGKGTQAAINYFKERVKVLQVDSRPGVKVVSKNLLELLA
ncbi:MAG TPA: nucleoside monophosphate kinase [Syntrophales bacterium]|nr:nucleoside monophosphate kinase [Syntrophales bacterium]